MKEYERRRNYSLYSFGEYVQFFKQDDATIVVAELSCGFKFWWMYFSLKEGKKEFE